MDATGTEHRSTDELQEFAELNGLPGVEGIRFFGGGLRVAFPDAEFVITMSSGDADTACETEWEVTVREPTPGLGTWWGEWRRSFPVSRSAVGPLIVEEVSGALARVRAMLDDHARGAAEVPQDA